jgi:dTDP-4-amino-4,6-dideoxygalactose transaminase
MFNSGSSANLGIFAALRYMKNSPLKSGDHILVPAVSWSTTYYPVNQCGFILDFVDIDLKTLNILLYNKINSTHYKKIIEQGFVTIEIKLKNETIELLLTNN